MRTSPRASAVLTIGCALSNAIAVAGLTGALGYPDLLNDPAGATLAAVRERLVELLPLTILAAISALLLIPVTLSMAGLGSAGRRKAVRVRPGPGGVGDASDAVTEPRTVMGAGAYAGFPLLRPFAVVRSLAWAAWAAWAASARAARTAGTARTAATGTSTRSSAAEANPLDTRILVLAGVSAAVTMAAGWAFWPVVVPLLADRTMARAQADGAATAFDALRVALGFLCGETLGPVLLAAWTLLVVSRVLAGGPEAPPTPDAADPVIVGRFSPSRAADGAPGKKRAPGRSRAAARSSAAGENRAASGNRAAGEDDAPAGRTVRGRAETAVASRYRATASAAIAAWRIRTALAIADWARPALAAGGVICAVLLVAGSLSPVGLSPSTQTPVLARLLWSLWLVGIGILTWVTDTRGLSRHPGARHDRQHHRGSPIGPGRLAPPRPVRPALARGPMDGHPPDGAVTPERHEAGARPGLSRPSPLRPVPFRAAPFRYAAYRAASLRAVHRAEPRRPRDPGPMDGDAVTAAGNEAITELGADDAVTEAGGDPAERWSGGEPAVPPGAGPPGDDPPTEITYLPDDPGEAFPEDPPTELPGLPGLPDHAVVRVLPGLSVLPQPEDDPPTDITPVARADSEPEDPPTEIVSSTPLPTAEALVAEILVAEMPVAEVPVTEVPVTEMPPAGYPADGDDEPTDPGLPAE